MGKNKVVVDRGVRKFGAVEKGEDRVSWGLKSITKEGKGGRRPNVERVTSQNTRTRNLENVRCTNLDEQGDVRNGYPNPGTGLAKKE